MGTRRPAQLKGLKQARLRSVLKSERMYELKSDADGRLFLDVVVGAPQIHTERLTLDLAERKAWESGGEKYLDTLAADVVRDGARFSERLTRP